MTPKKKTPIQTSKDQVEQEETTLSLPQPDPKLAFTISSHHKKRSYQKSGQYQIVGPKGGKTGFKITAVKGKPLPPTPKPGQGYVLVDETKHKDGK